jgi:hypothetical protein
MALCVSVEAATSSFDRLSPEAFYPSPSGIWPARRLGGTQLNSGGHVVGDHDSTPGHL